MFGLFPCRASDTGNGALGIGDALTKRGLRDRLSEPLQTSKIEEGKMAARLARRLQITGKYRQLDAHPADVGNNRWHRTGAVDEIGSNTPF